MDEWIKKDAIWRTVEANPMHQYEMYISHIQRRGQWIGLSLGSGKLLPPQFYSRDELLKLWEPTGRMADEDYK